MSFTLLIFLLISLAGCLVLTIFLFLKKGNRVQFIISLVFLVAAAVVLYFLFFSSSAIEPKGNSGNDIYFIIILYFCMVLGMLAERGYAHYTTPGNKRKRRKFDIGPILMPLFTSPIIFIPLYAALQNADVDIMKLTAPRLMVFFVAFENGFFWKGYLEKRREDVRAGVSSAEKE
jgi:Ca2+/Na+ antiporter